MLQCARSRRGTPCLWALVLAVLVFCRPAISRAQVAPGDTVPTRPYFLTLVVYNDGDYRNALAGFLSEQRGSIKYASFRWIDSICYYTMAGEAYYQLGQLAPALASYDAALKLYLANANWMMRVQFPAAILPTTVGNLRAAPWGQSRRGARVGQFSETYMMGQGQINNNAAFYQGGVVQAASMFPVHAAEIVRCTTLAMRRRREILGPVCRFDPLTSDMVEALRGAPVRRITGRKPGSTSSWAARMPAPAS